MAKQKVLIDTSVFISNFRGDKTARKLLRQIGDSNIVVSQLTAIELFAGCNTIQKRKEMEKLLNSYYTAKVNSVVIEKTISLTKRYAINHNVFAADCIIAANAVVLDIPLLTFNTSDFEFIKELRLYQ